MYDGAVDHVDSVEFAQLQAGGSFDDVCFRSFGYLVVEGKQDNAREVDNLSWDGEDFGSGDKLGFESVRRGAVQHESASEFEDEVLFCDQHCTRKSATNFSVII